MCGGVGRTGETCLRNMSYLQNHRDLPEESDGKTFLKVNAANKLRISVLPEI